MLGQGDSGLNKAQTEEERDGLKREGYKIKLIGIRFKGKQKRRFKLIKQWLEANQTGEPIFRSLRRTELISLKIDEQ